MNWDGECPSLFINFYSEKSTIIFKALFTPTVYKESVNEDNEFIILGFIWNIKRTVKLLSINL